MMYCDLLFALLQKYSYLLTYLWQQTVIKSF